MSIVVLCLARCQLSDIRPNPDTTQLSQYMMFVYFVVVVAIIIIVGLFGVSNDFWAFVSISNSIDAFKIFITAFITIFHFISFQ